MSSLNSVSVGPQRAENVHGPLHFFLRGLHEVHDELERVLVAAAEVAAEPLAAEG